MNRASKNGGRPGRPLTRVRSEWEETDDNYAVQGVPVRIFKRKTGDGQLAVILGNEPQGWHMSISFADHRGQASRYPTWDEIADARYRLAPADIDMVMHLPPAGDYVAVHDTTFHLHELRAND
jgi:hypothetical protein